MEISELFHSIQGEGKRAGRPSFFIRTNFCNLRCRFSGGNLCDTSYTSWDPDDSHNIGKLTVAEILSEYEKINCTDVVITGGEPAMQGDELNQLVAAIKSSNSGAYITLETNGTYFGDFAQFTDLASISPKLKSSVPYGSKYESMHLSNMKNSQSLMRFAELHRAGKIDIQWKFVFTSDADLTEIMEYEKQFGLRKEDIYLMPEGISREELDRKRKITAEACIRHGYNYTDRLHILLWGNKRGV
ncbi:MAG: 7-carboxy-7-deazaguanine synthase QueE [Ignavibacteria bacterium]|nr:7-carboxy-7-deazaguanine synthase QueE [Ignavibacteria bacterium]